MEANVSKVGQLVIEKMKNSAFVGGRYPFVGGENTFVGGSNEILGCRIATQLNLSFYNDIMNQSREAIIKGSFDVIVIDGGKEKGSKYRCIEPAIERINASAIDGLRSGSVTCHIVCQRDAPINFEAS